MTKIAHFSDTKHSCYALLEMDNGDPCWISVAQGVVVKKSRLGLLGAVLYKENVVYNAAMTAKALAYLFPKSLTPEGMTNPVLSAFTNAVLHASNVLEISNTLNEAIQRAEKSSGQPIGDMVVIPAP